MLLAGELKPTSIANGDCFTSKVELSGKSSSIVTIALNAIPDHSIKDHSLVWVRRNMRNSNPDVWINIWHAEVDERMHYFQKFS